MLGARIMEDCEKCLGLPMVGEKSKVNTFNDLWEKVTNRELGGGRNIFLKRGERS